MTRLLASAATLALVVLVSGCGESTDQAAEPASETMSGPVDPTTAGTTSPAPETETPEPDTTDPTTSAAPEPKGTRITTGDSPFGTMLFDAKDQAIYIWELEPSAEPTCYGDCAVKWPPVLTEGRPVAQGEVRKGLLGTTERRDGSVQVTYNDHPLYYYVDEPPGAVECHNISTHGGLWWVIQPDGDRAA